MNEHKNLYENFIENFKEHCLTPRMIKNALEIGDPVLLMKNLLNKIQEFVSKL